MASGWTPDQPIIECVDVRKSFGTFEVLKGISLSVRKGEVICIIGPSGSGKSTLIRCINALLPISAGSIRVEGIDVSDPKLDKLALRRKVGMVFQQYNLFPHKTALQNVMMAPIHVLGQDRREVETRAQALLAKVRLAGKEHSYPGELSGGQQQRVAIARGIVNSPAILLADEPTGNLDSENSAAVLKLMKDLNRRLGQTILMITHDSDAASYADRIVKMRDGRIV